MSLKTATVMTKYDAPTTSRGEECYIIENCYHNDDVW